MYKAFLIDLDGTSIGETATISPRVNAAIRRIARELTVSIVSSRDYLAVTGFALELGLSSLQISEGGARIFRPQTREVAWLCPMEAEDARMIINTLSRHGLSLLAVDGDRCVERAEEITDWRITRITATDLTDSQATSLTEQFSGGSRVHIARIVRTDNGRPMLDFTHAKANKATAVQRYARLCNIEPGQIIAAGDSYNDLPLLQACGLRIAMGNGAPELKAIADYVAPTVHEDGLAVAIEEFLLPRILASRP